MVRSLLDGQVQPGKNFHRESMTAMNDSNIVEPKTTNVNVESNSDNRYPYPFEQMLQQNLGDMSFCIENQYERQMRLLMNNSIMNRSAFGNGGTYKKFRVSKLEGCVDGPQKSLLNR